MNIEIRKYNLVEDFLQENETFMLENESLNNLILGLANRIKGNPKGFENPLFYAVLKSGKVAGQAIRTHLNKPLAVTKMLPDEINCLVDFLKQKEIKLEGVVGPVESSKSFSEIWSEDKRSLDMHQGIYELTSVVIPKLDRESLFLASENEYDTCLELVKGFIKDCFPNDKNRDDRAKEIVERNLSSKGLYLLKNKEGVVVSMAANVRESKNAATVSLVYTLDKYRAFGYGRKVTALLSEVLLSKGKEKCNLFTDLKNPTSNSIYQKIGYKKIGESMHFSFK